MTEPFNDDPREDQLELVMPFLVCASQGGPYDDDAYVAGFEAGQIETFLKLGGAPVIETVVRTKNRPQIDLIAMRHGYRLTATNFDEEQYTDWQQVQLIKLDSVVHGP